MPDPDLIAWARRLAAHAVDESQEAARMRDTLTALADALEGAVARIAELEAREARVLAVAATADGAEHDHCIGDGHDGCPACWAEDIRRALGEVRSDGE